MDADTAVTMPINDATREESAIGESTRFENVLVGVDGTATGRDAIALADRLRADGGRLTLAHVILAQTPTYRNFHSTPAWKQAREMLQREADAVGVTADFTGMFAPGVGGGLHQLAEDCNADLIVVGSCSRGLIGRVLVGDDARATVSGAPCPVAVAPHGYTDRAGDIRTIGVAYNRSPESELALDAARQLAADRRAALRARMVLPPTTTVVWPGPASQPAGGERPISVEGVERDEAERLSSLTGVDTEVTVGPAGDELLAFGDAVDLLVVGSRSHGPLRRLILGSTSLQLTREARCPLLIVPRPAGAEEDRDAS